MWGGATAAVKIRVKVFFTLRERLGWKEKLVELPENTKLRDLLDLLPAIKEEINRYRAKGYSMIIMINGRHAEFLGGLDAALHEGDEVAFFPPAAGG